VPYLGAVPSQGSHDNDIGAFLIFQGITLRLEINSIIEYVLRLVGAAGPEKVALAV
jgi:hypothetical protein